MKDRYNPKSYVLNAWSTLPWHVRVRDIVLTIIMWIVYLYFMRDFLLFVRDTFLWTIHDFDNVEQYPGLKSLSDIQSFIDTAASIAAIFISWALYNRFRYGKKKRRGFAPPVSIDELAERYDVNGDDLLLWQNSQILTIHLDPDGRLTRVVYR